MPCMNCWGIMVNERATGAAVVTSGEFTRAAIEAATRHGHVQLIDGDDLRVLLGPLPEPALASCMRLLPDRRHNGSSVRLAIVSWTRRSAISAVVARCGRCARARNWRWAHGH